jgi:putative FmdB family regulatory protein
MPTFDYKCTSCDHQGEITLPFDEFQKKKCPDCGSTVEQQYLSCNFVIHGYSFSNEYKGKSMYRDVVKKGNELNGAVKGK